MTTTRTSLPQARSARWTPLRAGIQNVWEYDDQRFVFHQGRLLLRGQNAAGKTKAIELLVPFLLDAALSAHRLDPFGGGSRSMYWNLINEGNSEVNLAIGHVWLELGRLQGDAPAYLTIGAGLRAKRATKGVEAWYFVTDQRVDLELHPLRDRTPLTRSQLEEAIGDRGVVYDRRSDYRQAVNQQLYGLEQRQYDALVETLLELRRPQLSKQLKPAELSRILSASLPPLDTAVVAPLAEGFERLDADRDAREDLATARRAVSDFLKTYKGYAGVVGKAAAQGLTRADSARRRARDDQRAAGGKLEAAEQVVAEQAARQATLDRRHEELDARLDELRSTDAFRAAQRLADAESRAREAAQQALRAQERHAGAQGALRRCEAGLLRAAEEAGGLGERLDEALLHADELGREAALSPTQAQVARLIRAGAPDEARALADTAVGQRQRVVIELRAENARVDRAGQQRDRAASEHRDTEARLREREQALIEAEHALEAARQRREEALHGWRASLQVLALDDEQLDALLELLEDQEARQHVARLAAPRRAQLDAWRQALAVDRARLDEQIAAAEREQAEVEAAAHTPPARPAWRAARPAGGPGAPLYLLCDFDTRIEPAERAGLEAALEAAGLLDAWVTPRGEVLDPKTRDVALRADPLDGPTLAEGLTPTPCGDVPAETITRVLRTIGLATAGAPASPEGAARCWVAPDGRWRLGPLHGASDKARPEHIGASARERARARRLEQLARDLAQLRRQREELARQTATTEAALRRLGDELGQLPSAGPLQRARDRVTLTQEPLAQLREELAVAAAKLEQRSEELGAAVAGRDALAGEHDLAPWIERLDALSALCGDYARAALELQHLARQALRAEAARTERQQELTEAAEVERTASRAAGEAERRTARAAERTRALRDTAGASHQQVLEEVKRAEVERREAREALERAREAQLTAREALGAAREAIEAARLEVERLDGARSTAVAEIKRLGAAGVLELLAPALDLDGDAARWSLTEALSVAREVDAATGDLVCTDEALESRENSLSRRERVMLADLPAELRVHPRREAGVVIYGASRDGRSLSLAALARELGEELSTRDGLLDRRERELIQEFLSGRAGDHLRDRLHDAHRLVQRMNEVLARARTSSEMQLRLRWGAGDDAPAGARQAIELMLRTGSLRTAADQEALARFLKQRLEEARIGEGVGGLQERMQQELDYRAWCRFTVELRAERAARWSKLTRKKHGAGSGGQKAVQLHLPLFAAAAAFYASADEGAPRLIVLDEAFAGIDHATRGTLMGLLQQLDLDFVMTSYDEWGCYAELSGLSIYHLRRQPGYRGVYSERFLWDGEQRHELGAGA